MLLLCILHMLIANNNNNKSIDYFGPIPYPQVFLLLCYSNVYKN